LIACDTILERLIYSFFGIIICYDVALQTRFLFVYQDHRLDALRTCFYDQDDDDDDDATLEERSKGKTTMRDHIQQDMRQQPVVMKKKGDSVVLVKFPRQATDVGTTEDAYLMTQLYIAERANACIEFASSARRGGGGPATNEERIVAFFDFGSGYDSSHAPPLKWQLSAVRRLQHLYPERLERLIILEAPFWMRGLFQAIRPFLSQATRQKIQMVSDRYVVCLRFPQLRYIYIFGKLTISHNLDQRYWRISVQSPKI
jgi:hypothetical protein